MALMTSHGLRSISPFDSDDLDPSHSPYKYPPFPMMQGIHYIFLFKFGLFVILVWVPLAMFTSDNKLG